MELKDYLTVAVAIIAIFSAIAGGIRWMVKHYLNELKPNGGSSMKDSLVRLEQRIDDVKADTAELKTTIQAVHAMVHKMSDRRNTQLIGWGVGIIGFLSASVIYLIANYVLK